METYLRLKITLIGFILCFISTACFAKDYNFTIVKVIDGDTLQIESLQELPELKLYIRVNLVDTPEKGSRAKCEKEAKLAEKASKFTKQFIGKNKTATFRNIKWDKYGGRLLADVEINGKSLSDELIKNGLARSYDGKKKGSWCE
jgi:micrococcal nuclease